jgi:Short C-terminal domain
MPGLIRGVARTAVVAGTATAVSNRVSRRQGNRWAEKDQAAYEQQQYEQQQQYQQQQYAQQQAAPVYAPPPQAAPAAGNAEDDRINTLKQLGELHAQGILTDEEFAAEKAKILSS